MVMKKYILYLLGFCLLLSCGGGGGGEDSPSGGSEYLNAQDVVVNGDQTSATLEISASQNCSWNISWSDSWISSISPNNGRGNASVTITITVNPSSSTSRIAIIKISNSSGSIIRNVTLTQSVSKEYMDISVTSMEFASKSETRIFAISSNAHWTISGGANWITTNKAEGDNNGEVSITVDENTAKESREATLTITSAGGSSKQLSIKQAGATFTTVSVPQITDVSQTSAKVTFSFDSNSTITSYGICYSTTDEPTIDNSTSVSQTATSNQGNPTFEIAVLNVGTTYYVRAYVFDADGIKYSNSVYFTTATDWPGGDDNNRPKI